MAAGEFGVSFGISTGERILLMIENSSYEEREKESKVMHCSKCGAEIKLSSIDLGMDLDPKTILCLRCYWESPDRGQFGLRGSFQVVQQSVPSSVRMLHTEDFRIFPGLDLDEL